MAHQKEIVNFQHSKDMNSNGIKQTKNTDNEHFIDFDKSTITDDSDIADPIPFVTVNGSTFASLGDISFISGVPKSGKSSITGFIIATALMKEKPASFDSLGIVANYQENRPIIYIDTEQHPAHTKKRLKTALKMAGIAKQDKTLLRVMNWRIYPQKVRYQHLLQALDTFKTACLWIIDGITDFVTSANNEEAGNELISLLMQKASENNAAIILLIHENGQNGKLRGHIGSEAERKCGGTISIKKDREKGLHYIEPKYLRDAEDFKEVVFRYDKEQARMVSVDSQTAQLFLQEQKDKSKSNDLKQLYDTCMGNDTVVQRAEFRKRIEDCYDPNKEKLPNARETYANRIIKELEKGYFIRLTGSGKNQTVEPFTQLDGLLMQNDKLF